MTIFYTSDSHFGHENIIKYCDRPFSNTDEMDERLISNWNEVVQPEDTVYHLGDAALGKIDKSLANVGRLNGYKILVLGNHDRPFMRRNKKDLATWWSKYEDVFQEIIGWGGSYAVFGGLKFRLSHFPFEGDSQDADRYNEFRPVDMGVPLIHGHVHSKDKITFSKRGTPMIHVGVDAWDYRPVSEHQVLELLDYSVHMG